jgi:predicted nucleic acid-binding protein
VRNLLIMNERRKRITVAETRVQLNDLVHLNIVIDRFPQGDNLLRLARDRRLTVYDAAYLELAMQLNLSLATPDSRLGDAAK